jgi:NRAMP (natural resistance-associated macrophage protein)-like metal ion transporter
MLKSVLKNIGPGPLVAAAFIGPGTVTLCTLVGIEFNLQLLWAIILSIIAAIVLQGMAVRIGIIGQKSIIDVLKEEIKIPWIRSLVLILIFGAIMIGNTAYEAGNISGAALGLETLIGNLHLKSDLFTLKLYPLLIGTIASLLLWIGKYKILERCLIFLVILMSFSFLVTAIATGPSIFEIFSGLLKFSTPQGSLLSIIGLVGTTIVPYNLFLHTELVREKWSTKDALPCALKDMIIALGLGGLISMSVIITAAGVESSEISNASDLALGLAPVFGEGAKYLLSLGLFAAGITSSITAPLAAAYVVCGCFGWKSDFKSLPFQRSWAVVILFGTIFASTGLKFILIIQFAQIANGILLPIIAAILLWIMNKASWLGSSKNNWFQNLLGLGIVIISLFLSMRTLGSVFQLF